MGEIPEGQSARNAIPGGLDMNKDCNNQVWHMDARTGFKYRWAELPVDKLRKSRYNPRVLKEDHLQEIKSSMEKDGQYCPITCVEIEPTTDGKEYDILDGSHRHRAAVDLAYETIQAKVYHKDTPEPAQKKMAIYLNQGVKRINAGEFYRAADDLYNITVNDLKSKGAKVINEARVIHATGLQGKEEHLRLTVGRIVHRLQQDGDAAIHDFISDAQVPKKVITEGEGPNSKRVLTAMNVGYLLRKLCRTEPLGPWEPWVAGVTDQEYEQKLLNGEIEKDVDLREDEYANVKMLTDIIADEILNPWLAEGQYDQAMIFCKHHVLRGLAPVISRILENAGSNKPSAPLYVKKDAINWDRVKEYILKLKRIYWTDPVFTVRVPERITDFIWAKMFTS
jgi:hypothetical protein